MLIPYTQIESACSTDKDAARDYYRAPYLDIDRGRVVATNSYIMAAAPVIAEAGDVSGSIPCDALAYARKRGEAKMIAEEDAVTVAGATFRRTFTGFIEYEKFLPTRPDDEPDLVVDVELLRRLGQALYPPRSKKLGLKLWLPRPYRRVVYVEPANDSKGCCGVIVPMQI